MIDSDGWLVQLDLRNFERDLLNVTGPLDFTSQLQDRS